MKSFRERHGRELGMLGLMIALIIFTAILNPNFFSFENFRNVSRSVGVYGILSIAVGVVIITAGIDLSIGSLLALLGILFFYMLTGESKLLPQLPWPLAALIVIASGAILGLAHGLFVGKVKMQAFVVTLCGLLVYRGLARTISDDNSVGYSVVAGDMPELKILADGTIGSLLWGNRTPEEVAAGGGLFTELMYAIPMTLVYLVIIAVVMGVVMHRTVFGRYLYASGRNELAARYSGINTTLVICSAYVICGVLTAFAALPFALFTGSVSPTSHGNFVELYAIAGAVLGGCALKGGEGSIVGILIGATILVLLSNVVNMLDQPSSLRDVITGGVLFVGVLLNQIGLARIKRLIGMGAKQPE